MQLGFPIRKSSDQSLFAAPRSLSQRTTSFIAFWCQGIHQTPFLYLINTEVLYTELFLLSQYILNFIIYL